MEKEKITILEYLATYQIASPQQLNHYLVVTRKTMKTTSSIYKYIRELTVENYIEEVAPNHRQFMITDKGRLVLRCQGRKNIERQRECPIVNIFIYNHSSNNTKFPPYYNFHPYQHPSRGRYW